MRNQLFHVFRNTPLGREALLHSRYFCQQFGIRQMDVYIPSFNSFNMSFGLKEVIVFLDKSYLRDPETAAVHANELLADTNIITHFHTCKRFKDRDLPEIPTDFKYMTCPRVLSDAHGRFGLGHVGPGHIGPAVNSIVKHATFPVMIASASFVPWTRISVLFGGSALGLKAVKLGLKMARRSRLPIQVFTHDDRGHKTMESSEEALAGAGLFDEVKSDCRWKVWTHGNLNENLYDIPRDSIVLLGAAHQGPVKELTIGSMLQKVQAELPHPLLVVGPAYAG